MARRKRKQTRKTVSSEAPEQRSLENPTIEEVEAKWAEYKTAKADREAKQTQNATDRENRAAAIQTESDSYAAYVEAWNLEKQLEDEHEQMAAAHEPPPMEPSLEGA